MAKNKSELTVVKNGPVATLHNFETGFLQFLESHGLPQENIFVGVDERVKVFSNLDSVVRRIDDAMMIEKSLYISKFLAATAAGLFDAALSYLWNETILQIRKRVSQYDLEFFYDSIMSGDKRTKFRTVDDLVDLQDYDLIRGAKEIGLVGDVGFKHLEFINYMRNWASAAHPNSVDLTGLQLISWLETCVKEVITLPVGSVVTRTKELLNNLRKNNISEADADEIADFFDDLPNGQADNLAGAFFAIYTRNNAPEELKQNVAKLAPRLWKHVSRDAKNEVGLKYAHFKAHGIEEQKNAARQYIEVVQAQEFIPDGLRSREINTAIEHLLDAHRGWDNFHNEPPFARAIQRAVGEGGTVPKSVRKKYVRAVVEVFLTNGVGTTRLAQPIYGELLNGMSSNMLSTAFLSFRYDEISAKLQHHKCRVKFDEVVSVCKDKITSRAFKDFMDTVVGFGIPYHKLRDDSRVKREIEAVKAILASK